MKKNALKTKLIVNLLKLTRFPVIKNNPEVKKWYRIPLEKCVSANGTKYHTSVKIGTENKLMIFFYGGGVSWNQFMAARPISVYGNPDSYGFYASDSDLLADLTAKVGSYILSDKEDNPFRNWNMIVIPYSSGDFHCGTGDYAYVDLEGREQVLHHHGYKNYRWALQTAMKYMNNNPEEILVTGFSAGGFGTALLTDDVMRTFPNCKSVTSYVDSGFMLYPGWHDAAKDVWKAPNEIVERIHSDNITLDCLQALKKEHGDRVRIAFSCSVRDSALAEYVDYVEKDRLFANKESGIKFQDYLKRMCQQLMDTIPEVSIFIFDTLEEEEKKRTAGLTKHCISAFDKTMSEGITAIQWIWDTVNSKPSHIGLSHLDKVQEGADRL